jgi:glycosyltransferase involved in cell wall biosynthesis
MKILFMHPNMPGQYKHLIPEFVKDKSNEVVFITKATKPQMEGVRKIVYQVPRDASPHTHRYLIHAERAVLQGQEVWRALMKLKREEGFVPDIVVGHPGWGDALYVKDVYPDTPFFGFFEFFYHSNGADVGFDPADPVSEDDKARIRTKNMHHMLGLEYADWGISPTFWQHSLHPKAYQNKISVIHDGINTEAARPDPEATLRLAHIDRIFKPGDEVVTYIARNFEPYRGFPTFMQAAEKILRDRPNCHIIAIGADDVSYGRRPPAGTTYRQIWSQKVKLDTDRIHFVGTLPYTHLLKVLQISAAHIYLTYPFVLSWSSMEAMACGCAMVASDTQPVREVIQHGHNGFLVDFFNPDALAEQVYEILDAKDRMQSVRDQARQDMIDKYDLSRLLPLHKKLIEQVAQGQVPPPADLEIQALYKDRKKAA